MTNDKDKGQPAPEKGGRRGRNLPLLLLLSGLALIALMTLDRDSAVSAQLTYAQFRLLGKENYIKSIELLHTGGSDGRVEIRGELNRDNNKLEDKDALPPLIRNAFTDKVLVKLTKADTKKYHVDDVMRRVVATPAVSEEMTGWVGPGNFNSKLNTNVLATLLLTIAPWFLLLAFFYFFILRPMRQAGGAGGVLSFGRSRARLYTPEMTNITFDDVAGIEEAKDEVLEIIEFLRNPQKFQRLGGRIPRGVMLVGAPGTGKTLLAKAIAGEAGVPFFAISGSDFVEMFVGVGASRVRDLFQQAKEKSPCLIFLDEIDAVGRRRGSGLGGGHDEREQTLNQILVEMDGFDTDKGIIVVAATNRPDVLDPALLRPGRFDRQITIDMPDVKGREAILTVHARGVKLAPHVDLGVIARGTPGFSGAELEAIINEGAIGAAMQNHDAIALGDLEEARDRIRFGRSRHSRVMTESEKRALAHHEAGHALMNLLLPDTEPLHKVTIIPRGMALGATMSLPERDRYIFEMKRFLAQIKVLYSGRIAEKFATGDLSTGAQDDIRRATDLARQMVMHYGMSDVMGPLDYAGDQETLFLGREITKTHNMSDETAQKIDLEITKISRECYAQAEEILTTNREKLDRLAEALFKYESLNLDEVKLAIESGDIESYRKAREPKISEPKPEIDGETQRDSLPRLDRGPAPGLAGT